MVSNLGMMKEEFMSAYSSPEILDQYERLPKINHCLRDFRHLNVRTSYG